MEKFEQKEKGLKLNILMVVTCALAAFSFILAYSFDNKYTAPGPQAVYGVLTLDEHTLADFPRMFLINAWEYYSGRLLTPEDFRAESPPVPDQHIYIGQYGGFEAGELSASPHGSATYRLIIVIPDEQRTYMLNIPEIFTAYKAYVNGTMYMQMGDPDPERFFPETGERAISFKAGGIIEIIISASDFAHTYSGMTFPPVFGMPQAVSSLQSARLTLRSTVCAVALTVAMLSALIGPLSRSGSLTWLYSLLCICFVGYVCYPITKTFISGFQPFYAIENLAFCAMLLITMWIQNIVCGEHNKWSRYFMYFGAVCCAAAIVLPLLVRSGSIVIMYGYSYLITAYEWIAAAFITFTAIRAVIKNIVKSAAMLCGILIFDCALIMDRLLPLYEPIITGWFIETASFALVLAVGVVISRELAGKLKENVILTERKNSMELLSGMQQGYYAVLRQEMEETKAIRHDMRHHFTVIDGMLKNKQVEEAVDYISRYGSASLAYEPEMYCDHNIINILAHHYTVLSEQNRIRFDFRCELTNDVRVSDADLCGLLSNLLENAVEACSRIQTGRRFIRLGISEMGSDLIISLDNSTDGGVKETHDAFLSSKAEAREGYGLKSIRTIAERYSGTTKFSWDKENRAFSSIVILR